jgi:type VI secretion system protein ImpK
MDRINWVTSECFNAIAQLSKLHTRGNETGLQPDLIHARMKEFVGTLVRRAREAGYSEQDARLILYAVAALADEVMMSGGGELRDFWAGQPLQMLLFRENLAGERFFEHLESVRQSPQQIDVLRTYYLCLLFGFRGRYGVRGAEVALNDLIESVRVQLGRALAAPEVLAPNGARPEEGLVDATRRMPLLSLACGFLMLAGVLYLGLAVSLREQLEQFVFWTTQTTGH